MSGRPELKALTGARGLAAWAVVLFHVRFQLIGFGGGDGPLALGNLAVDFFFVLSGFVIWLTYVDQLRTGGLAAIPRFLQRRIARVWPLHMVMLGGMLAFAFVVMATGRPVDGAYPFAELPLHVLLVQNWGFTPDLSWNVPAWSISCELAAYLVFPLLVFAIDWRKLPAWLLLGVIAALAGLLTATFGSYAANDLGAQVPRFGLVRCLLEFAIGTIICALWLRWRDRPLLPALGAVATIALLTAAPLLGLVPGTLAFPMLFAAAVLLLALTSGLRGNPFEWAPVHYLGEISYATYLSHWLLWIVFKILFISSAEAGMSLPLFALFAAVVLAASIVLYHGVERPAQRWINRLKLPQRQRDAAAAAGEEQPAA